MDTIRRGHLDAARQALRAGPLREELCEEIERDCEALRSFLNAAHVSFRLETCEIEPHLLTADH